MRPVMFQRWSDLLFIHWAIPEGPLRKLLPKPLEVDTFEGRAYIGLVHFHMQNIRVLGLPPVPGLSAFPETNVRTYVRHGDKTGVYFFSLDAANSIAVKVARTFFHLNYIHSEMEVTTNANRREYLVRRFAPRVRSHAICEVGDGITTAQPGTLDHFLIERYRLFSTHKDASQNERVFEGMVRHAPYQLRPVRLAKLEDDLVSTVPLTVPGEPILHFSDGVDVDIFPIERSIQRR